MRDQSHTACKLAFSLVFTPYLWNAVVSGKSSFYFHAFVALKLLVSLIGHLVACTARISVDRQTKYCNPRCACAPRVNDDHQYHPYNTSAMQDIVGRA